MWYDRLSPGPNMPEDKLSIDQVGEHLSEVIRQEEVLRGKVIVGGFSMGGSMALHMGYRFNQSVAGVFALSSFLPADSAVFSVHNFESCEIHVNLTRKMLFTGRRRLCGPQPTIRARRFCQKNLQERKTPERKKGFCPGTKASSALHEFGETRSIGEVILDPSHV